MDVVTVCTRRTGHYTRTFGKFDGDLIGFLRLGTERKRLESRWENPMKTNRRPNLRQRTNRHQAFIIPALTVIPFPFSPGADAQSVCGGLVADRGPKWTFICYILIQSAPSRITKKMTDSRLTGQSRGHGTLPSNGNPLV